MIDLHSHVLPGIDDGAIDLDDSVSMARQAAADGIVAVCATPHIRHDHDVVIDEIAGRVAELNADLERRGVDCKVLPGGEVAETAVRGLDQRELPQVSLGGAGRWLLLEPAPGPLQDSLVAAVAHLAKRGIRSVVAHPERHLGPHARERLAVLVRRGALIQATAASLLDEQSSEAMLELADRGFVHVLGSDAHSSSHGRRLELSSAFARVREASAVGAHIDWIMREAPAAIVSGRPIVPPFEPRP